MSKQKKKSRIDVYLYENDYFPSRERARSAIMAGLVFVNESRVDKPGFQVSEDSQVLVRGPILPYVSRGGLKLEKAFSVFGIDINGKIVLDVGASTGGFTDCALQKGAALVYAVDVGYGQLDWKLRNDPRVIVLERTNIRNLSAEALGKTPDFTTIDVSFISLNKIMRQVGKLTCAEAAGVALIKPQFEAGRDKVGKKGVVRDPDVHREVIRSVVGDIFKLGWKALDLTYSPIKGPEGNIEYLLYFVKHNNGAEMLFEEIIDKTVEEAHEKL
ncbi:MAG: TlyA family RNA methyltransferase [Desulfotomaculaceae bacterium]